MAEGTTGWFGAGSSPTVNTKCNATLVRNGTTMTLYWSVDQNIGSGSHLGYGSLVMYCGYNGNNDSRTMKDHNSTWSGGDGNTVSGTITFTDKSTTGKNFWIGFWSESDAFSSSGLFDTGFNLWVEGYDPSVSFTYTKAEPRTNTSIAISYTPSRTLTSCQYRINNGTWTDIPTMESGSWNTGGTFVRTGLSANTKYTVRMRGKAVSSGNWYESSDFSTTTYPNTVPTISVSSKTVNSITVTSGCNVQVSSTQYRIKQGSGSYGAYQNSATFSNLTPNTSYTIEVKKVAKNGGAVGYATTTASTYQIGTITTASNFNHGDNSSTVLANPSGASISLNMKIGSTSIFTDSVSAGTKTHTYTDTELDNIYKLYGMGNTLTATYTLTTTANSKTYTNTKTCTITLTGNQKTIREKVNGVWKRGKNFVKINGTWKKSVVWQKVNGAWKRGI